MSAYVPHPLRIQRNGLRAKLPPGARLVTRPSRWGNPYLVEDHGRVQALALYEHWVTHDRPDLKAQLSDLRGRQLACYCELDQPCHADVLARLANEAPA